jgi:transglutaminase-like putative cysteine protease
LEFHADCTLRYQVRERSTFIMNVAAANAANQRVIEESFTVDPAVAVDEHVTPELANHYHRFVAPPGPLTVRYTARAAVSYTLTDPARVAGTPPDKLPLATVPYIVPSRYCQSDQLMRLAFREFARVPQGFRQVQAICDWIHANVDYIAGTTGTLTTALDTATQRAGVCRDFAHLGVAFCRALNIPARFVSGYTHDLDPPDFHALFEAWLDGAWHLFDPTKRISRPGFVRIGTGRDAADVPFALIIGAASMQHMTVRCAFTGAGADGQEPQPTDAAVTIA